MPIQPADEHDDPDAPDGVDPYPALSFAAVKWLNQRTGGPTGAYPDLPKVLTPVFYAQIDQSQPVAVLRTHREQTTAHLLRMFGSSGGVAEVDEVLDFVERMDPDESLMETTTVELLVALCSFARFAMACRVSASIWIWIFSATARRLSLLLSDPLLVFEPLRAPARASIRRIVQDRWKAL